MGEARQRRLNGRKVVYHHSSILVTNRIWMNGVQRRLNGRKVVYHHSSILVTNRIWMNGVLKPNGPGTDIIEHPKLEAGKHLHPADMAGSRRRQEDDAENLSRSPHG
jgi:hypothetical protein